MRNVCFLFGINGVGKSTLAEALSKRLSGSIVLSASSVLRRALGGLTRAELEALQPEEKGAALRHALIEAFRAHARAPTLICDTHLAVPIRRGHPVRYERMWDAAYEPFAIAFIFVTAPPAVILRRRREDAGSGARLRDLDAEAIEADARVNFEEFQCRFGGRPETRHLHNEGHPEDVAARLMDIVSGRRLV